MKRLLFITHRVPYPPDKGERVRAFHEILALARHFRVTLASLAHDAGDVDSAAQMKRWCEDVLVAPAGGTLGWLRGGWALLCGRSATEGYFSSPRLRWALREEARREPFDVVVAYSSSTLPYALGVPAGARVMDLVDVDSAKWAGYADAARWPRRWLYRRESRAVRALEQRAVDACDAVTLVSRAEAQVLGEAGEKTTAVGNGVDTDYFQPAETAPDGPPALVFTGTMDYRPNADGVGWFVREVWPALRREVPDLVFWIVGRNPTPPVQRLAEVPGVKVTGSVPDVRPYLAGAAVAVVPLLIARGIQNKVLEAMAMGRAVVGSSGALEGLDVVVGKDVRRADTPQEWRGAVLELIADAAARGQLERAARACVLDRYGWDARLSPLVDLCLELAAAPAGEAVERSKDGKPLTSVPRAAEGPARA